MFSRTQLAQHLPAFSGDAVLSESAKAYQQFYAIERSEQCRLGYFTAGAYRIACQAWWPENPVATVIVLHGYFDHMGLYRHVLDWALSRQCAVLMCDLPGHGLSSGAIASIDSFAEYQAVLQGLFAQAKQLKLPQPWHLLGQSTGAGILIEHLLSGDVSPAMGKTALLAPLVRPTNWRKIIWTYHTVRHFTQQVPRRFSENSSDPAFLTFLRQQDPLQSRFVTTRWVGAMMDWERRVQCLPAACAPIAPLVVQGECDGTVDWRYNLPWLQQRFAQLKPLKITTARHHLVNEAKPLRESVFAHLTDYFRLYANPC